MSRFYTPRFAGQLLLIALLIGGAVWSQGPPPGGPRFFGRGSLLMLVQMPDVQQELGINDSQRPALEALQDKAFSTMQSLFRGGPPPEDATEEVRQQHFDGMRTKSEATNLEFETALGKLLEPKQLARLEQLRLQQDPLATLGREEIAKKLSLTEGQRQKLRELQQPGPGFVPPRVDPAQTAAAIALLTDQQKTRWNDLIGAPFKFPENRFFGPGQQERKLVKEFDQDNDGRLNAAERQAARKVPRPDRGGRPGGPRSFGPPMGHSEPGKPGPRVSTGDVPPIVGPALYDETVLRTIFLDFENNDWEAELADFHSSDVEVPATLTVDGKVYPQVGVHFRGMSSYGMVGVGSKRSLNVSLDFVHSKQRLYGYKTLNLLNQHEDPTLMHTVLYSHVARQYLPAPKANWLKVVINGESWGVYTSAQQFDKVFLAENYSQPKGTRWKVSGSPGGNGGLDYLGEKIDDYKRRYEMKSDDGDEAWRALITLCRTLKETPLEELEQKLAPLLDLDGVLWFLALDNALINSDGYWIRASDYSLFRDGKGQFHVIPHDVNETFQASMGPGMMRGGMGGPPGPGGPPRSDPGPPRPPGGANFRPGGPPPGGPAPGGGYALDPLVGMNDTSKPLRSRLLVVPVLREKYLAHVRTIARDWLDWQKLGPLVAQYRTLLEPEVTADTRKLTSLAAFQEALAIQPTAANRRGHNLYRFAQERRKYLLEYEPPK